MEVDNYEAHSSFYLSNKLLHYHYHYDYDYDAAAAAATLDGSDDAADVHLYIYLSDGPNETKMAAHFWFKVQLSWIGNFGRGKSVNLSTSSFLCKVLSFKARNHLLYFKLSYRPLILRLLLLLMYQD